MLVSPDSPSPSSFTMVGRAAAAMVADQCSSTARAFSLRRKLEPDPERPRQILSEPGYGYVLDCPSVEE
jgi:hypothetical protein